MTTPTTAQATALSGVTVLATAPLGSGYVAYVDTRTDAYRLAAAVSQAFAADPDAVTRLDGIDVEEVPSDPVEYRVSVRISRP